MYLEFKDEKIWCQMNSVIKCGWIAEAVFLNNYLNALNVWYNVLITPSSGYSNCLNCEYVFFELLNGGKGTKQSTLHLVSLSILKVI